MPGLINSINPKIKVGGAVHMFDIAWLFGVSTLLAITHYRSDMNWFSLFSYDY